MHTKWLPYTTRIFGRVIASVAREEFAGRPGFQENQQANSWFPRNYSESRIFACNFHGNVRNLNAQIFFKIPDNVLQ